MPKKYKTPNSAWAFNVDSTQNWAYQDNFFSAEQCKKIIEIGEGQILDRAKVAQEEAGWSRDSKVAWLYPSPDCDWIYRTVTDGVMAINNSFFNFDLFGLIEGFQFTRYDAPSGFYGMHIDKILGGSIRKLSITIQLSDPDDYDGGELAIQIGSDPLIMPKEQGKLVCFPSYVLHEVRPVTRGTRYSLVAWVTGKPFK